MWHEWFPFCGAVLSVVRQRASTSQGVFKPFRSFSPPMHVDITKGDATPPGPAGVLGRGASSSFAVTPRLISLMKPQLGGNRTELVNNPPAKSR